MESYSANLHNNQSKIRVGELLLSRQLISEQQLQTALKEQKLSGRKLGQTLVKLGFIEEDALLKLLSETLNIPFVDLKQFNFHRELVQQLPETIARRFRVILLEKNSSGEILLGMADPTDIFAFDEVSRLIKNQIIPVAVKESELLDVLDLAYSYNDEIANLAEELEDNLTTSHFDLSEFTADSNDSNAPVVRLLKRIFEEAITLKASDIHIEPDQDVLRIRKRIDGILTEHVIDEKYIASALIVRLKLIAGLDISEKRHPQDGRFHISIKNRDIDVRISTMPVQFGESVVMRLLDHSSGLLSLEQVGMQPQMVTKFRNLIMQPYGLILTTGPTGSGKTTTMFSALAELNTPDRKIITVEDPVEYRLPRVNQVQVNEKIGLEFNNLLRATLRQDPDILLIGEIRDRDSAEIALRASITGHLVLSTVHTSNAIQTPLRLIDIGVDVYLVATALKAIFAQRLVRRICESCAQEYQPTPSEEKLLAVMGKNNKPFNFKQGIGCPHCNNTGYRGRIGVFELLTMNRAMVNALHKQDIAAFTKAAEANPDYQPFYQSALHYAQQGLTSLHETMRVFSEASIHQTAMSKK